VNFGGRNAHSELFVAGVYCRRESGGIEVARSVAELREEIAELSPGERGERIMALISDLDAQHDPAVVDDTVEGVPADVVFDRIRSRLGE